VRTGNRIALGDIEDGVDLAALVTSGGTVHTAGPRTRSVLEAGTELAQWLTPPALPHLRLLLSSGQRGTVRGARRVGVGTHPTLVTLGPPRRGGLRLLTVTDDPAAAPLTSGPATPWTAAGENSGAGEDSTAGADGATAVAGAAGAAPPAATAAAAQLPTGHTAGDEQRWFRSLFQETTLPSALISADGRFTAVNAALSLLTGRTAAELLGQSVDTLRHADDLGGAALRHWTRSDHGDLWVEVSGADLPGAPGPGGRRQRVEHYLDVTAKRSADDRAEALQVILTARLAELDAARTRLALAFRAMTEIQEAERRRLAIALHDDPVQQLVAITWLLEEVNLEPATAKALHDVINAAMSSLRELVTDLRPPSLGVLDLTEVLAGQMDRILGPDIATSVTGSVPSTPSAVETLVYRTVVEALRNIRRHSGARHAHLELSGDATAICVRLSDDGVGFNASQADARHAEGHIGVASMREQVVAAGGRFTVGARADGRPGTEVVVVLPLLTELTAAPAAAPAAAPTASPAAVGPAGQSGL
jgi:signal transduction histidine kinase